MELFGKIIISNLNITNYNYARRGVRTLASLRYWVLNPTPWTTRPFVLFFLLVPTCFEISQFGNCC